MTHTPRWSFALAVLFTFACVHNAAAQFGPLVRPGQAAQARSQEELDVYLEVVTPTNPNVIVEKVNAFVGRFPRSELLAQAYQYQTNAFARLDNFDGMLAAGQKALLGGGDNLNTLLTLAPTMADRAANRPDRSSLLSQAEDYARRALDAIEKTRIPRSLPMEEWLLKKKQMQSSAHEVLGTVAFQRGQQQAATHELQTALELSPQPQGSQFYKLGLALIAMGQKKDAEQNFIRSVELGPEAVRELAMAKLNEIKDKDKGRLQK